MVCPFGPGSYPRNAIFYRNGIWHSGDRVPGAGRSLRVNCRCFDLPTIPAIWAFDTQLTYDQIKVSNLAGAARLGRRVKEIRRELFNSRNPLGFQHTRHAFLQVRQKPC